MMKKALLALLVLILSGCSEEQTGKVETESKQQTETAESTTQPAPAEPEVTPGIVVPVTPGKSEAKKPANRVVINTTKGKITLELFADKAPKTVENFRAYISEGFYDGTIFHRVINGFMIQGGGYDKDYNKRETRPPVLNEADNGLKNARGTIAMARTRNPHSATAQFFINHRDNRALDHRNKGAGWGYAVFGKVVEGMDVVDAIATTRTGPGGPFPKDAPLEMVVIENISIVNE
jgi:cyclophilin family peptidyl-prolyl cis-trans isomerase